MVLMRLTILGSSASTPTRTNAASGYLVEHEDATLWMDAGTGTYMELAKLTDPGHIDAVVISHMHVDHCSDLFGLYGYLAYGPSDGNPVPVFLPRGGARKFEEFVGASAGHVFNDVLDFHEVAAPDTAQIGPLSLSFGTSVHSVTANVTRIKAGDSVLSGADLLLCESSLVGVRDAETYRFHLTAKETGQIASRAGVGRLVLTHIPHTIDPEQAVNEASAHFSGPVSYAAPGTVFEI
jgi:ribonuclease BN (tRNA processing enzyme)